MTDLFTHEGGKSVAAATWRPTNWRKPSDPREHVCRNCAGVASCGVNSAWYCVSCAPEDFWPKGRGA